MCLRVDIVYFDLIREIFIPKECFVLVSILFFFVLKRRKCNSNEIIIQYRTKLKFKWRISWKASLRTRYGSSWSCKRIAAVQILQHKDSKGGDFVESLAFYWILQPIFLYFYYCSFPRSWKISYSPPWDLASSLTQRSIYNSNIICNSQIPPLAYIVRFGPLHITINLIVLKTRLLKREKRNIPP